MAETDISVASAVEVSQPELDEPTALKRQHSEEAEQEQEQERKRQRVSPGKNSLENAPRDDAEQESVTVTKEAEPRDSSEARRKPSIADEKQRSKRLFGALLGGLNQPGDRTSKRRQEIESRRKAELKRQDDERVENTQRRAEKLAERRKREQERVDELNMRTRHSNMLHAANFLQTTAEPKIYYRPWDLRSDEENRIDEQVKDAQAQIDQDLEEFEQGRNRTNGGSEHVRLPSYAVKPDEPQRPDPAQEQNSPSGMKKKNTVEENEAAAKSDDSKPSEVPDSEDATNPDANPHDVSNHVSNGESSAEAAEADKIDDAEEEGDHVVDGDEDTAIY